MNVSKFVLKPVFWARSYKKSCLHSKSGWHPYPFRRNQINFSWQERISTGYGGIFVTGKVTSWLTAGQNFPGTGRTVQHVAVTVVLFQAVSMRILSGITGFIHGVINKITRENRRRFNFCFTFWISQKSLDPRVDKFHSGRDCARMDNYPCSFKERNHERKQILFLTQAALWLCSLETLYFWRQLKLHHQKHLIQVLKKRVQGPAYAGHLSSDVPKFGNCHNDYQVFWWKDAQ